MKEATRLLIESGIIPESAARLCQMWNGDNEELPAVKQRTEAELRDMVSKIVGLMEDKEEIPAVKETELDLDKLIKYSHLTGTVTLPSNNSRMFDEASISARVGFSRLGKLVIRVSPSELKLCDMFARKGNEVVLSDGRVVMITNVEPRYEENVLAFYVCDTVERPQEC